MSVIKKLTFVILICCIAIVSSTSAQTKNSPFSPNPPANEPTKKEISKKVDKKQQTTDVELIETDSDIGDELSDETTNNSTDSDFKTVSVADKTREVVKKANRANLPPTQIYQIGIGDVLFINLQNSTAKYFTVLMDGTIDYPLAGKLVTVVGLTTEEVEDLLREKIKLYENPQVTVKVREYSSHKIKVEGLARSGDYFLQREAMPLVVVKTMVGADSKAKRVVIERENSAPTILDLSKSESDVFLIQKGDILKFEAEDANYTNSATTDALQFYFFGEKICSGGKKTFHSGLTLVQAIFNACGGMNDKLKDVSILRKDNSGKFITLKYNVKNILQGKETDPILKPGDMIDSEK